VFNFVPANDPTVEKKEVVSITILDDLTFTSHRRRRRSSLFSMMINEQARHLDKSRQRFHPENGADDCRFTFTRTGQPTAICRSIIR